MHCRMIDGLAVPNESTHLSQALAALAIVLAARQDSRRGTPAV